jgi:hypothetical protein
MLRLYLMLYTTKGLPACKGLSANAINMMFFPGFIALTPFLYYILLYAEFI